METLLRKYVVAWAGVVGSDCWVGSIGKPGAEADVTEYDDLEDDDHEVTMDDLEEDDYDVYLSQINGPLNHDDLQLDLLGEGVTSGPVFQSFS